MAKNVKKEVKKVEKPKEKWLKYEEAEPLIHEGKNVVAIKTQKETIDGIVYDVKLFLFE